MTLPIKEPLNLWVPIELRQALQAQAIARDMPLLEFCVYMLKEYVGVDAGMLMYVQQEKERQSTGSQP